LIVRLLNKKVEEELFEFMNQDRIRNFWGIYDLKYHKDKTRTWIAFSQKNITGYLLELDKRILHIRGNSRSVVPLLKETELTTPLFNVESAHLTGARKLYNPTEPTDRTSESNVTTYLSMKVNKNSFKPFKRHPVQEMTRDNVEIVSAFLNRETSRVTDLLKGLSYGLYKHGRLASFAAAPEILEDLAIIRGVYTALNCRGKGYATSVCSAIVEKLLKQGREVFLYVSKENPPALGVYQKLGFEETGHVFLSFQAEKRLSREANATHRI
jgi:GNAT superfamily N-acetyltransferase